MTMYKSPIVIMPEEFDTRLKYIVDYQLTALAGPLASLRFTSNAYDVDPQLGSTAMAGFAEFGNFYSRFRTLNLGYKFNVCNMESFPVSVIHGFGVTSIASGSLGMNYGENPLFTTAVLGPTTGQSRASFSKSSSIVKIFGTGQPLFDDLFTGSTTSNTLPSTATASCYLGVAGAAAFTAAGVWVHSEITLVVRFFRRNLIIT